MKDIFYFVVGEGYPIVFLHGNGENHHIFDELVSYLKNSFQCIMIDTRYHGKSIKKGEMSYQQFSLDIKNVIDELQIDEYDVVGFSDGAIISILLANLDERLKHMVLIGANVRVSGLKTICRFNDYLMLFCLLPFCLYNQKMRIKWRLIKMMETMKEIPKVELKKIRIPTLILAGEYDMIKEKETHYIHSCIEYSVEKIIKNGNHFLLRDSFHETYNEIRIFLDVIHTRRT